jgi:4-amino-4-deoxy-L-arabinose transferase-like glycosyltransferase
VSTAAAHPVAQGISLERARSWLLSRDATIVLCFTVLAAVLRFWRIGHQGFWFDEANTALLVHFSPGSMLGLIPQSESTPPLYYCVAWVWARVFGYTEAPLRSLSAVVGVATVPVAYGAAAQLTARRAGLIAAALTACNPLLIWYSQEARSYSMLVFLSSASLLAFAYARKSPTRRRMAIWVFAAALALGTHYYALLAVVPQAVWLLALHRRTRAAQVGVAIAGLCGAALIPLAISQNGTGRANWISTVPLSRRIGQVVPQFVASFEGPAHGVLEPLAIGIVVLALVLLATRAVPLERRGALVAGGLALGGLVLNLLLIAVGVDDLITRNLLALWMPAAVLVAAGLAAARARRVGLVAVAVVCGIGVATAVGVALDRHYERPDWRSVAALLGHRPAGGPRAIFVQHYRDLLPLSLYLPRLRWMPKRGAKVSEVDVVTFSSPPSAGFCWWGSACNVWPSQMQARYSLAGFHAVWRRQVLQFTVLRLVSASPRPVSGRELRPVLTATRYRNDELLYQH